MSGTMAGTDGIPPLAVFLISRKSLLLQDRWQVLESFMFVLRVTPLLKSNGISRFGPLIEQQVIHMLRTQNAF